MVDAQDRQHRFALSARTASVIALALGVLVGVGVAMSIFPDAQGFQVGLQYGLILGVAAAVSVLGMRAATTRGVSAWLAGPLAVLAAALLSAVAFALTQRSEAMLLTGAVFGGIVGILSTLVATLRTRRPAASP